MQLNTACILLVILGALSCSGVLVFLIGNGCINLHMAEVGIPSIVEAESEVL